jgi:uncharacterized protein (DUF1778 family)
MPLPLARLVRIAATKQDTTRSAFMCAAGVQAARNVLGLDREEDLLQWIYDERK